MNNTLNGEYSILPCGCGNRNVSPALHSASLSEGYRDYRVYCGKVLQRWDNTVNFCDTNGPVADTEKEAVKRWNRKRKNAKCS